MVNNCYLYLFYILLLLPFHNAIAYDCVEILRFELAIDAWLKDKLSGDVIYRGDIVDRKWAGLWGGDDSKGIRDFAQKVEKFINKGLKDVKSKK